MNKVGYTTSNKKIAFIALACAVLLIMAILPISLIQDADIRAIYVVMVSVSIGLLCLKSIKKAKNAYCPLCSADLYNVIDTANNNKINVSYCPACGANIEI